MNKKQDKDKFVMKTYSDSKENNVDDNEFIEEADEFMEEINNFKETYDS